MLCFTPSYHVLFCCGPRLSVVPACRLTGVTGPDIDQDQITTTLRGHCAVLKFQDQAPTCQNCQAGQNLVLNFFRTRQRCRCLVLNFQDHTMTSEKCCCRGLVLRHRGYSAPCVREQLIPPVSIDSVTDTGTTLFSLVICR